MPGLTLAQTVVSTQQVAPAPAEKPPAAPRATQKASPPPVPITPPPPINPPVSLDAKEAKAVALAEEWKAHPDQPRRGEDGSVVYLYGATLPTLVCMQLRVCSIRLQPGEVLTGIQSGDPGRWDIKPNLNGPETMPTTYVTMKPVDPDLVTNLLLLTDRRTYIVKLVSTADKWMPMLSFDYPEDQTAAWTNYQQQQAQRAQATTLSSGLKIDKLDFNFKITVGGKTRPRWTPVRVYSDGTKTYIQFPTTDFTGTEAPVLVALQHDGQIYLTTRGRDNANQQELVNYHVVGDHYVVDQVIDRAALITGVGDKQITVVIEHQESKP
jgi:type IV secretion system protein VirB9